jgi:hypothetical protein
MDDLCDDRAVMIVKPSSWPVLAAIPSSPGYKDVDARHKAGRDETGAAAKIIPS